MAASSALMRAGHPPYFEPSQAGLDRAPCLSVVFAHGRLVDLYQRSRNLGHPARFLICLTHDLLSPAASQCAGAFFLQKSPPAMMTAGKSECSDDELHDGAMGRGNCTARTQLRLVSLILVVEEQTSAED
jgi:hypothetical protein